MSMKLKNAWKLEISMEQKTRPLNTNIN
jgi:hypothetical protein